MKSAAYPCMTSAAYSRAELESLSCHLGACRVPPPRGVCAMAIRRRRRVVLCYVSAALDGRSLSWQLSPSSPSSVLGCHISLTGRTRDTAASGALEHSGLPPLVARRLDTAAPGVWDRQARETWCVGGVVHGARKLYQKPQGACPQGARKAHGE